MDVVEVAVMAINLALVAVGITLIVRARDKVKDAEEATHELVVNFLCLVAYHVGEAVVTQRDGDEWEASAMNRTGRGPDPIAAAFALYQKHVEGER